MISADLAKELQDAGLEWVPELYDVFMIPDRDLDDRVFVISDLTIGVDQLGGTATIMFNGAVEWSLDYIFSQDVVWLPTERQLRELVGDRMLRLTRESTGWCCAIAVDGATTEFAAVEASDAYGQAVLHLLAGGEPVGREAGPEPSDGPE
jgi:hypothetical protein